MFKRKGFTILELIIASVILGVVATMAISPVFGDLPEHKVNNDIITVEQALKMTKSEATKTSSLIITDFAQAASNNGDTGGLIQVKDSDGTVLRSFSMNKNVLYNSGASTIANNQVRFDYKGQPVDKFDGVRGFEESSNTISISFYNKQGAAATKSLEVQPVTGNIKIN